MNRLKSTGRPYYFDIQRVCSRLVECISTHWREIGRKFENRDSSEANLIMHCNSGNGPVSLDSLPSCVHPSGSAIQHVIDSMTSQCHQTSTMDMWSDGYANKFINS